MENFEEKILVGGRSNVIRRGNILHRSAHPWSPSIHSLLRHLEKSNFTGCPRVIGTGFDEQGRELLVTLKVSAIIMRLGMIKE